MPTSTPCVRSAKRFRNHRRRSMTSKSPPSPQQELPIRFRRAGGSVCPDVGTKPCGLFALNRHLRATTHPSGSLPGCRRFTWNPASNGALWRLAEIRQSTRSCHANVENAAGRPALVHLPHLGHRPIPRFGPVATRAGPNDAPPPAGTQNRNVLRCRESGPLTCVTSAGKEGLSKPV